MTATRGGSAIRGRGRGDGCLSASSTGGEARDFGAHQWSASDGHEQERRTYVPRTVRVGMWSEAGCAWGWDETTRMRDLDDRKPMSVKGVTFEKPIPAEGRLSRQRGCEGNELAADLHCQRQQAKRERGSSQPRSRKGPTNEQDTRTMSGIRWANVFEHAAGFALGGLVALVLFSCYVVGVGR